jgi:hypothetical protein
MTANFYLVTLPDQAFFFIGIARRLGKRVALCAPDGRQVLTVPRAAVRQSTKEQVAAAIATERRAQIATRN